MNKKIKNIVTTKGTTIKQVMKLINTAPGKGAPAGIALIIDKNNKLLGVVTDGDIRRATLKNINLDSPVEKIMIKDPITVTKGISNNEMLNEISIKVREKKRLHDYKVDKVIIVDDQNRVEDVISFFELWRRSKITTREICIVGLGFVGLTLALSLADVGFKVIGIDKDEETVRGLKRCKPHFHEVGLDGLLQYHINKSFFVKSNIDSIDSDVYIICVDTPVNEDHKPVIENFKKACSTVGGVLKKDDLVIVRSTVPVGTCRNVVLPILEKKSGLKGEKDFYLTSAPERTVAGKALEELRGLPQIIGGIDMLSSEMASNLFRELTPIIVNVDTLEAAELIKLIDNTFRDLTFAYSNELGLICDKLHLDAVKVIKAANEGYIRNRIPTPSPGVGGSCLTKDPYILADVAKKIGYNAKLIKTGREVNEYIPLYIAGKIIDFCKNNRKDTSAFKIFIIGFAFKGDEVTSDTRKSTTIDLINHLNNLKGKDLKIKIFGYDPVVVADEIRKLGATACELENGFEKADCIVIMNNNKSYADMDIYNLLSKTKKPSLFFDGWHIFSKEVVKKVEGIVYDGFGVR